MKKLTLNLTVYGGISVLGIIFKLFKKGIADPVVEETKSGSFSYDFELEPDTEYDLYIIGSNPISENKRTIIKLDHDHFTFDPTSDKNPVTKTGKAYLVTYSFNTN
ncbi:hypothetical protein HX13_08290 [Chryseobacterium sp. P1-3]|uniref:Uncharacterized protein n=1 Tax=Chryseobacterium gallinarum TaxID=1324352 RepID=A0ABX6KRU6_CHRGL|nr:MULTISPECIES: hypothetical protein [Chryseobacterium]KFF75195.1 hypothetical protein HX13_08290 [Chryseobacterium sp. P1-3]MCL8536601.1 hypothetical protein [Chryseobacterium gallinarum]QIY91280.1 hypothetical protein FOB44_11815 [Chryseobacterium gallinarum]